MKINARKYISLLLALCMVMSLLPAAALAATTENNHGEHSDWTELNGSISSLSGNCYLTGDVTCTGNITISGDVTLCLNGYTLNLSGSYFRVESGSFTLCDCDGSGKITGGAAAFPAVYINKGNFTMTGGSITGNSSGIWVQPSGDFTMTGGSITRNTFNVTDDYSYTPCGGVLVSGGSFTMTGGEITGNTVNVKGGLSVGGGVLVVNYGRFTMTGGEITNNRCEVEKYLDYSGIAGGVCVGSQSAFPGTFIVSDDATISGNTFNGNEKNVWLYNSQKIEIGSGGLKGGEIGVTRDTPDVFTSGGGASCRQYFFSDSDSYVVVPSGSELALGLVSSNPHKHCVCGKDNCTDTEHSNGVTFTRISSLSSTLSTGSYCLTRNVTAAGDITISGNVTLCLNGRTLDLNRYHIIVPTGSSLTLCDCGTTGKITGGSAEQGGAVLVNSSGILTLHSGSITGNTASGGGDGSSGSNRAGGGAVCVNGGSFNMTGGSIENNTANVTMKNDGGGGVLINSGSFNMSGGFITCNSVSGPDNSTGGGVHVNSGTFTMTNGVISNNSAPNGGGVTVFKGTQEGTSSFTLSGGSITGNSATEIGGGVYVLPNTEFKLSGAPDISGNTAGGAASNIYLNSSTIALGTLTNTTSYGVSMEKPGVFTSGGGATYIANFTSDDSEYDVQISNGELCLSSGYTVTFDLGGAAGTPPTNQEVENGGKATKPTTDPTWEGHTFAGWYNGDTLWNFGTAVTGNMTLTAKWITNPVVTVTGDTSMTYGDGGTLTANVTEAEDHTYTYQWYSNTTNSNTGGTIIEGAVSSIYTIPNTTNRGTYYYYCTVTASIDGSSKTASATSDDVTVTVSEKGYDSGSGFTISDIADQNYTGSAIQPKPVVKDGDKTLTEGTDYTLYYGENVNVGTGSVIINFTGNYSGETTVYFNIVKAAQTAPAADEGYTIDYKAETITVEDGYEVYTAQSGGTQITSGSITDYLGQTLYIRKTETGTHNASGWTEFTIASRPAAPGDEVIVTGESVKGKGDGTIIVPEGMEYSTGGENWVPGPANLTGLAAGTTVTVRVQATATAPHGEEQTYTVQDSDVTLTVTFDENGGSAVEDATGLAYGDKVTAPAVTRDGYTLDGWYNGDAKWDFSTGVNADLTLTAKWTLNKPTVTLSADKNNVTYGTKITLTAGVTHAAGGLTYTYEWYKGSEKLNNDAATMTLKTVADSGSYTVKVTASDGSQRKTVESSAVSVSIGKAEPNYTVPSDLTATYGDRLSSIELPNGWAWDDGSALVGNAGERSHGATFTPTDTANYDTVKQNITVQVDKATLTPSVGSVADKIYDGNTSTTGAIALTGAVLGENPTASGVFTFDDADAGTDKTVKVTVTLGDGWASNYVLAETELTTKANITPKTVGLEWSGYENLVYNGEPVGVTAKATGLVSGDTCAVTVENGAQTNAGTYTAMATGLNNPNYQLPDTGTTRSYTIAPRPVELSWSASSFTYDGNEKTVTATIENLVNNDDCTLTYRDNVKTEHGSYTAEVTALGNANYTLTNGTGLTHSWSIGKAVVSFTVSGNSHTYDGDAKTAVVTQDDGQTLIPADGYIVTYDGEEDQTEAGTYDITVTITDDNFCFAVGKDSMVVGKLTIGEQAVEIPTPDDTEFVYNGAEQTYAIAESELYTVEGDVQKDAGSYTVIVSLNDKANYTWSDGSTEDKTYDFVIAAKPVTATWMGLDQVYGDGQKVSLIIDGLEGGDSVEDAVITGISTEAGSHQLTVTLENYVISPAAATLVVQQKPVVITVTETGGNTVVSAPGLSESDYKVTYKDRNGNTVTDTTQPGTYEIWVELTNPNYRHTDGSSNKQVGSFTVGYGPVRRYTISFSGGNGASGNTASLTAAGGSYITLPECGFTKPGSVFTGWKYGSAVYKPGDSITMPYTDITITAQWTQTQRIGGTVKDEYGVPVAGAAVSIWLGSDKLDEIASGSDGAYSFTDLAPGSYNILASVGDKSVTTVVTVGESGAVTGGNIILPEGNTSTRVEITPGSPDIVVGELDRVFDNTDGEDYTAADAETVKNGGTVEITFTADEKKQAEVQDEVKQLQSAGGVNLSLFLECTLEKEVYDSEGTKVESASGFISQSSVLLEVRLPLPTAMQGKYGYNVLRIHEGEAQALSTSANSLGEYFEVSADKSALILHLCCFSTYAVGYENAPVLPPVPTENAPNVSESEHGSVTVFPNLPTTGTVVTVTPKPDEGYAVDRITVTDASGNAVEVKSNGDGTYSFTQPAGAVTITATFKLLTEASDCPRDESCPMSGYTDLDMGAWYHDGIHYCLDEGLMDGVGTGLFAPNATTSRAMIVTILWRLRGSPEAEAAEMFTDVAPGDWYADAIAWAASEGVAEGYEDGSFRPNDAITREQLAAMLWRYAGSPGSDGALSAFVDWADTSSWAQQAMSWAVAQGLITGVDSDSLSPKGQATRAQTATILMRFAQSI